MLDHSIPTPKEEATDFVTDPETGDVRVKLHSRKYPGQYALVSPEDVPLISGYRWNMSRGRSTDYAEAKIGPMHQRRTIQMHRLIMGVVDKGREVQVDHINHNGLDNRRSNLRLATHSENLRNQGPRRPMSRYKGVKFDRRINAWIATISVDGAQKRLGPFNTEKIAARAYDVAALEHYGEFAFLNFPEEVER